MITLTPSARQAVGEILAQQKLPPTAALRLGVTSEGCEGSGTEFRYVLDFDPNPGKASDQVFESDGLTIVVDHESLPHLDGLELDAQPELGGVRFLFQNPRANHSCGCGRTFSE